jgi:hypothetical protein
MPSLLNHRRRLSLSKISALPCCEEEGRMMLKRDHVYGLLQGKKRNWRKRREHGQNERKGRGQKGPKWVKLVKESQRPDLTWSNGLQTQAQAHLQLLRTPKESKAQIAKGPRHIQESSPNS